MTTLTEKIPTKLTSALVGFVILATGTGLALSKAETSIKKAETSIQNTQKLARSSAETRVKTVEQRCKLTDLLIHGVTLKTGYKAKLEVSLNKCHAQLAEVEKLAKQ